MPHLLVVLMLALPWSGLDEPTRDVAATVLWVIGDASVPAEEDILAEPLAIGDRLFHGQVLELDDGARVSLLIDDDELARLHGPGVFRFDLPRGLQTVVGPGRIDHLPMDYVAGPCSPVVEPTTPAVGEEPALAIDAPRSTAVIDDHPALRWRWHEEGGRFDLALWRSSGAGAAQLVERWRGLAGRELVLWAPLERGWRYRWTVSVAGGLGLLPIPREASSWFEVLSASRVREVRAGQARFNRLLSSVGEDNLDVEVQRAFFLESHNLLERAAAVWAAIVERPVADSGSLVAARRHLARVRGRKELPYAAERRVHLPFGFEVVVPWASPPP